MCELFGLSAATPLSVNPTPLAVFRRHGGETADNPDGWGMAWRDAGRLLLEKEPLPGWRSARFADLIATLCTDLLIAHVRRARHPPVNTLANTHPFLHECCGRAWAFAHNGLTPGIVALEAASREKVCQPDGETDSEFAFCHLLGRLARCQGMADSRFLSSLGGMGEAIARHGQFNFLLSDGVHLIAYGHDRLHYLETAAATMIATEPLSGHNAWTPFTAGEMRIYRDGRLVSRSLTHPPTPTPPFPSASP